MLNSIGFNNISYARYTGRPKSVSNPSKKYPEAKNSDLLMNSLNCVGVISFGSLQSGLNKVSLLKRLEKFVAKDIPVDFDTYQFMIRNPRGFYLECGREVNKFLRMGTFNLPIVSDNLSPALRKYLESQIVEKKALNRTIVESLDILDAQITSKTSEPMTVYRDAPRQWMDKAKDGILTDAGYFSTSTERGASMEGLICNGADNFTYEIHLPKGTPFWDLTDTAEKEMLLPRGCKFKIVGNGVLELIQ